jgi:hypothetical protein
MTQELRDLREDPAAIEVVKKPMVRDVRFAERDGVCETLEGDVHYRRGDALVAGEKGEEWPVEREKFEGAYAPVPPVEFGEPGAYRARHRIVLARQLASELQVPVGWQRDPLTANPGDWLVQYGPMDFGVVKPEVFEDTYVVL